MKIAIQGLGEVPTTTKLLLEEEKPDVMYIICLDYQLNHVASYAGYTEPNGAVIKAAAKKVGAKLLVKKCNVFDPEAISLVVYDILQEVKKSDEVVVNYAGDSADVKLILCMTGVVLSRLMRAKILYAIEYPKDVRIVEDRTRVFRDVFRRLYEFV